jgi:hypothetical protein
MVKPRAAMLVAITAQVSSITGGAVAATVITSSNIKDGTIQLRDLSPAARAALKGQRGPRGVSGPPGSQGVAGGFDLSKITIVTSAPFNVPAGGGLAGAFATCLVGSKLIGGGGGFQSGAGIVAYDAPLGDREWEATSVNPTSTDRPANAYAICVAP